MIKKKNKKKNLKNKNKNKIFFPIYNKQKTKKIYLFSF